MGTASGMVKAMRAYLGMGEPNAVQEWYRSKHGSAYGGNFPWCDALVTKAAHDSGNAAAVLPGGDRAYTPWHANDFKKAGRWHSGTTANVNRCKPGDVVFFDWGGSNSIGTIDHVGVVEKVLGGGRVQTIEGNTSNVCARRVRGSGEIAGYGRPAYDGTPTKPTMPAAPAGKAPRWPGRYLTQPPMMSGSDVRTWQARMKARGWHLAVDGAYGPGSEKVCRAFQREKGLTVDGVVGPKTWATSWTAPIT